MKSRTIFSIVICIYLSNPGFTQNIHTTTPLSIGEKVEFQSKILKEKRTLNIYLPQTYSKDSLKTYPVIYLLDGSMDEDFIHISGLVQFGSFSWIKMIPESIVVGIANVDRKRDFTFPTNNKKDKEAYPTTGRSENFISFIEKELQPLINKKYKTNSVTTLIGQSLGGLLATEILFKQPDMFDNYIIASPSLWWDDESLLTYTPASYNSKKSIYIAVGKEGTIMERVAKELYDKLKLLNKDNTKLYFEFFEKQNHGDALHLAVYDAFEKMFKLKN
ncbi:alpha/beta hydrolase [Aquimarina litoralis]|uniref:alpha/beta hydrolase n=1 Tax=Aquimarina litoralis TaxID=584605 RepID=UPI001C55DA29|nr:alpha/beta hydrolase-fold protein [Aquimarina litoralis]MBW1295138.1 alpha/beta hydrolase [Aquimarina litoralis]